MEYEVNFKKNLSKKDILTKKIKDISYDIFKIEKDEYLLTIKKEKNKKNIVLTNDEISHFLFNNVNF